jgi:peptidoglycan/xylan/chitin deacetylase (PgdA/CDA1 family)
VRRQLRRHGLILMYHRIAEVSHDPWKLCVTPSNFREQLDVLTRVADVVPLPEFSQRLKSARAKRPTVAITFDDGYRDNCTAALPLLQSFNAPATIFLITGAIGRDEPFWSDLLPELIMTVALPAELELDIGDERFSWRHSGPDVSAKDRGALHLALWSKLWVASDTDRAAALRELCRLTSFDPAGVANACAMTREELKRVQAAGIVELGAHTVNHCPLPKRSAEEQRREISGSLEQCEALLGRVPTSFAYPYGQLNAVSRDIVAECGFARACTTSEDLAWAGADPLLLPRFNAPDFDGDNFERRLRSLWLI